MHGQHNIKICKLVLLKFWGFLEINLSYSTHGSLSYRSLELATALPMNYTKTVHVITECPEFVLVSSHKKTE